jgi:hypothetical protein
MIFTFLDLTIRVGCHLTYEATAPTPVVFMLRPRLDDAHLVTIEKRSFEPDLPSNEFQDSHGNLACRSMLHEFERFKLPSATLPLVTRMFFTGPYGTDSETTAHQTTASCSNAAFWHSQQSLVAAPSTSQDSLAARRVNDGRLADLDMHAMSRVFASDGVAIS